MLDTLDAEHAVEVTVRIRQRTGRVVLAVADAFETEFFGRDDIQAVDVTPAAVREFCREGPEAGRHI